MDINNEIHITIFTYDKIFNCIEYIVNKYSSRITQDKLHEVLRILQTYLLLHNTKEGKFAENYVLRHVKRAISKNKILVINIVT